MNSRLKTSLLLLGLGLLAGCSTSAHGEEHSDAATGSPVASSTSTDAPGLGPSASASAHASPSALIAAASSAAASAAADASAETPAEPPPCPTDMVLVGRSCVDRYEAFLLRVDGDGATVEHPYYARPEKGVRYRATNRAGAFPQAYISRVESKAACEEAGKRLCSMNEWKRACKGKGYMTYPYAQRGERGRCNTGKLHLLTEMFGKPTGGFKYDEHFNSPDLNKTPGYLAPSGSFEGCVSDLGVFDMVGNLHEWVKDTVDEDLVTRMKDEPVERRDQPWREGNGVFMSGFYSTTSEHGPGCFFTTIAHEPAYHDYSTGFRCCADAKLPPKSKPAPGAKPAASALRRQPRTQ